MFCARLVIQLGDLCVRSGSRVPYGTVLLRSTLGPGDGVMLRRQLLGIKERAEQHSQ